MKRLIVLSSFLSVMISGFAQEAANSKIQAGLTLSSGLNFISPNTKVIESNGVGSNLGV